VGAHSGVPCRVENVGTDATRLSPYFLGLELSAGGCQPRFEKALAPIPTWTPQTSYAPKEPPSTTRFLVPLPNAVEISHYAQNSSTSAMAFVPVNRGPLLWGSFFVPIASHQVGSATLTTNPRPYPVRTVNVNTSAQLELQGIVKS